MKYILIGISATLLFLVIACKKKSTAGLGGQANLKLTAKHHGVVIDSVTFYVKFNATDAPSVNSYDIVQNGITYDFGNTYTVVYGLKKGQYYLFAQGWDPTINESVKGGIPYTIDEEKDIDFSIAVTE